MRQIITAKEARQKIPVVKAFDDILEDIERSIKNSISRGNYSCEYYLDEREEIWDLFEGSLTTKITNHLISLGYTVTTQSDAEVDLIYNISWGNEDN